MSINIPCIHIYKYRFYNRDKTNKLSVPDCRGVLFELIVWVERALNNSIVIHAGNTVDLVTVSV